MQRSGTHLLGRRAEVHSPEFAVLREEERILLEDLESHNAQRAKSCILFPCSDQADAHKKRGTQDLIATAISPFVIPSNWPSEGIFPPTVEAEPSHCYQ